MPQELLLRHAQSDGESGALNDFDRPRAKRGRHMPKDWEPPIAGCAKLLELRRPQRERG